MIYSHRERKNERNLQHLAISQGAGTFGYRNGQNRHILVERIPNNGRSIRDSQSPYHINWPEGGLQTPLSFPVW